MAQRYQDGHLRRAKRRRGPDVWEFLWREFGPDGKRRQRTLTVGSVDELRTEREALNRIQLLRTNINRDLPRSALMTFEDLANHYRQTELLADNKTEKTRATYLVYLKNWILPVWGKEYLHSIKAVAVEHWLRNLGSRCGFKRIASMFGRSRKARRNAENSVAAPSPTVPEKSSCSMSRAGADFNILETNSHERGEGNALASRSKALNKSGLKRMNAITSGQMAD